MQQNQLQTAQYTCTSHLSDSTASSLNHQTLQIKFAKKLRHYHAPAFLNKTLQPLQQQYCQYKKPLKQMVYTIHLRGMFISDFLVQAVHSVRRVLSAFTGAHKAPLFNILIPAAAGTVHNIAGFFQTDFAIGPALRCGIKQIPVPV